MDRQTSVLGTYDALTGLTTWTLPYDEVDMGKMAVITSDNGMKLNVTSPSANTLECFGDSSSAPAFIGKEFRSEYELSEWIPKDNTGNAILGNLRLKALKVRYKDTGSFQIEVTAENRDTMITRQGGLEPSVSLIENPPTFTDKRKFLIAGKSDNTSVKIVSETVLPCIIESIEIQGDFYQKR